MLPFLPAHFSVIAIHQCSSGVNIGWCCVYVCADEDGGTSFVDNGVISLLTRLMVFKQWKPISSSFLLFYSWYKHMASLSI